ncbi:hypothetical protein BU23DRAFT_564699 [Bimuria novae-zelandiae CBS 107.79]|uniref:Uncharacterized protein n=1 Tax=Bimuria novae-zelandiae CBS 107.79 TaxID=1447943 RepID=A0A6A5VLU6_9PLEO|nr:hypothetical protein BU23DRAFT_564699 [Bimuria novae-zelandiae CBS 107.79]
MSSLPRLLDYSDSGSDVASDSHSVLGSASDTEVQDAPAVEDTPAPSRDPRLQNRPPGWTPHPRNRAPTSALHLNAPTGPKSTQASFQSRKALYTKVKPEWRFNGVPTPLEMHNYILHRKTSPGRNYFSITTIAPPNLPWSPLTSRQNMETRPCHNAGSRIHMLSCGHTIAVPRDAQPCAQNCSPPLTPLTSREPRIMSIPHSKASIPTPYASFLSTHRASIAAAVNTHIAAMMSSGDPRAAPRYHLYASFLSSIWSAQDASLQPRRDLLGGDFSCGLCSVIAHRESMPAAVLYEFPYACIVVGREEADIAIIRELQKGVRPSEIAPPPSRIYIDLEREQKRAPVKRFGVGERGPRHRRSDAVGGEGKRWKEGRIGKMRREEKEGVLGRLREEIVLEKLEAVGLGGKEKARDPRME